MSGGGAGDIAWLREPVGDYRGTPTDSTYKVTGHEQTLDDLTIENALRRLRNLSAEVKETIATTFEGAISVSGVVTEDTAWLLNHVFGQPPTQSGAGPYTYEWAFVSGGTPMQSARFYTGLDHLNGYAERELKGVVFPQVDFENPEDGPATYTLTGFFADEELATTATPGSPPSTTSDPFIFHSGNLDIDATTQTLMESATLSIQTGARGLRGWERKFSDAVIGAEEHTLSPSKIVESTDLLTTAYGNSTAPAATSGVDSAPATLVLGNGSETLTFDMPRVTPNTHSWDGIGDAANDKTESVELYVDTMTATLETSTAGVL
jgi:hypothetical protein